MKKAAVLLLGLILTQVAVSSEESSFQLAKHDVTLSGLQAGEGRYILSKEYVNNQFKVGVYSCVGAKQNVYHRSYQVPKNHSPFHEEHLVKFSICQDDTLANCHEFAVDKYAIFKKLDGYLQSDVKTTSIDISTLKNAFQGCDPGPKLDEVVKQAIHENDRRFAHIG